MRQRALIASATVAGAIVLGVLLHRSARLTDAPVVIALAALSLALSQASVELRSGVSFLLDTSVVVAAFLLQGPLAAAIVVACSVPLAVYIAQRTSVVTIIFNSAQQFVAAGVAGSLMKVMGLSTSLTNQLAAGRGPLSEVIASAMAFVLCMHFINAVLLSVYVAAQERSSIADTLRDINPLSDIPSSILLALMGVVLAALVVLKSWLGVILLVVPVLAVRKVFRIYVEMAAAYSNTVGALVEALEEKDPYTRGHSDRVARYCRLIGEELGLPASDMTLLERAALLHDIGKMGVPDSVLQLRSELSLIQTRLVRQHPTMAVRVLDGIDFLEAVLPLVRSHHERLDGSGYPDGLSGSRIPFLARIVAVADAFDAMTSDRPYRPRLSTQEAVAELQRGCDTQFDSTVVSALLRAIKRSEDRESFPRNDDLASRGKSIQSGSPGSSALWSNDGC